MEVSDFLFTKCVWGMGMGMLRVVFNMETENYYSKSTFIMTLIKQENNVFISIDYFINSALFMCFYKIVHGYPYYMYPSIQRFPNTVKHGQT